MQTIDLSRWRLQPCFQLKQVSFPTLFLYEIYKGFLYFSASRLVYFHSRHKTVYSMLFRFLVLKYTIASSCIQHTVTAEGVFDYPKKSYEFSGCPQTRDLVAHHSRLYNLDRESLLQSTVAVVDEYGFANFRFCH